MARVIKFRGQSVYNGEWLEGYYGVSIEIGDNGGAEHNYRSTMAELHYIIDVDGQSELVFAESVGQFIGLTDKNGKDVFEDDIVSISRYSYDEPIDDYFGKLIITNFGVYFMGLDSNGDILNIYLSELFDCYCTTIEVIGNIHGNPDLIKGGE